MGQEPPSAFLLPDEVVVVTATANRLQEDLHTVVPLSNPVDNIQLSNSALYNLNSLKN